MTRIHLKTEPRPFVAVWLGIKRFEFRREDRHTFQVGDELALEYYGDPENEDEITRPWTIWAAVTYVARGEYGIPDGYAVLSIEVKAREGRGPE